MREIKFRAWVEYYDEPDMVYLTREDLRFDFEGGFVVAFVPDQYREFYCHEGSEHKPKMTLMQYTGLIDKNGKEIYEGDVLRVVYDSCEQDAYGDWNDIVQVGSVSFSDAAFQVGTEKTLLTAIFAANGTTTEVIGNVYENPELLTTPNDTV